MSILFLDKIKSGIPTTLLEGKDVSDILLINPDPNLPAFFLVNKAVLRTATKEIDVYDGSGILEQTIDISETDLTAITEGISDVNARVDDTNDELERNVAALNIEVKANYDLATLSNNTAEEAKGIASNAISKANENESDITALGEDLQDVEAALTSYDGRITSNTDAASAAQNQADKAHNLATSAQTEAAANTVAIAASDVIVAKNSAMIKEHGIRLDRQKAEITTVKQKARSNQLSVDTLEAQMKTQIATNETQDSAIETLEAFTETNQENIQTLVEDTTEKFTLVGKKFDAVDLTFEALGVTIDDTNAAFELKINEMDAERDVIQVSLEATQVDVGLIQDELAIEGLGGFYRQGSDLETASILSNGSGFIDELYLPPDSGEVTVDSKPLPIGGTYQYHVKNENGSYTKLLSFDKDGLDIDNKPIVNLASGQNTDTNAANIGDVKRLISGEPDGGLLPTNDQWDMLSYPLINAGSVGFNEHISSGSSGASYARFTTGSLELGAQGQIYFEVDGTTVGDINRTRVNFSGSGSVLGKNSAADLRSPYELINWETLQSYPDNGLVPTNDIWNMTGYPLSNVPSVGYKEDHTGARVGFEEYKVKLLGDTVEFKSQNDSGSYGSISADGLQLNALEIKNLRESSTLTSAATVGQVNYVQETADLALSKTTTNETNIGNLGITVGTNTSAISDNAKSIVDVNTLATAADTLSKENKEALDSITIPNVGNLVEKDSDASLNSVTFGNKTKIDWQDGDLGLVLQGDTLYAKAEDGYQHFYIERGNFNVKSKKIQKLNDGVSDDDAVNKRQLDSVGAIASTNTATLDTLSGTVESNTDRIILLESQEDEGLVSDAYGWNMQDFNVYNVNAVRKTNGDYNSNGISFPEDDVNIHGDVIGFTSKNSGQTYLTIDSGGLNLGSKAIRSLASGGDTDGSAANIGDVKRIAADSGGLLPTGSTWDMLGYPVINIGTSTISTSAATVGQVNVIDGKVDTNANSIANLGTTVGQQDTQIKANTAELVTVKSTATAADTLSKTNKQRLDSLPPSPDLDGYAKLDTDVSFNHVTTDRLILKNNHNDAVKDSYLGLDSTNQNTVFGSVGSLYLKKINRETGDEDQWGLVDSSGRMSFVNKIRTPMITNPLSWSNSTSSSSAGFIDLSEDSKVKLGAKTEIKFSVNNKNPIKISENQMDFSGLSETFTINHSDNIDVVVGGVDNVAFKSSGMKLLRDVDGNNHNITKMGDINFSAASRLHGASAGDLELRNVSGIHKNDSTDNNSVTFSGDDIHYKANHHMFYPDASTSQMFGISGEGVNLFNHNLIKVKHILGNSTGSMNIAGVKLLKRNDDHDTQQSIQLNDGDITAYSDKHEWKTNENSRRLTIENHEADFHGCKVKNVADAEDNKDVPNLAQVNALIAANGGSGGIEFKVVKTNVTGSPQYFYHSNENHMFIEYTGNGGTIALDSMRSGVADQIEDMTVIHNKTDVECYVRLFYEGSSVTYDVKPRSYLQGWANREIGQWVVTTMKDPTYVPEQLVIKSTDLNWSTATDPRTNTQRMIAAAPAVCTIIGRHSTSGSAKEKIVSTGDSNRLESQNSIFVINKQASGHATGICTSEESSGKTWSRVLDGKRGAWFTNESANSRMVSSEIDPTEYPEEQIFFTSDQGVMETYLDDSEGSEGDAGVIKLRPLAGYNVPEQGLEIEELKNDREANAPITRYFKNESVVTVPYTQEHPVAEVWVLDTTKTINGASLSLVDDNTHKYSGIYNSVGSISIVGNKWTTYSYHNAFKHASESYYIAYDMDALSWFIVDAGKPHTSVNEDIESNEKISLDHRGQLPESYGDYTINLSIDNLDSLEFIKAETNTRIDTDARLVITDFGQSKPSGKIVIS